MSEPEQGDKILFRRHVKAKRAGNLSNVGESCPGPEERWGKSSNVMRRKWKPVSAHLIREDGSSVPARLGVCVFVCTHTHTLTDGGD